MLALHRVLSQMILQELREDRLCFVEDLRCEAPEVHRNKSSVRNRLPAVAVFIDRMAVFQSDLLDLDDMGEISILLLAETSRDGSVLGQRIQAAETYHRIMII